MTKYTKPKEYMDNLLHTYDLYEKYIGCSCNERARRAQKAQIDYKMNIENEICIKGDDIVQLKKEYYNKFGEKYEEMTSCERYRLYKKMK
jgi:hypothetical protein